MNILITPPKGEIMEVFFPDYIMERIQELGKVFVNETELPLKEEDLLNRIKDIDICITHWIRRNLLKKLLKRPQTQDDRSCCRKCSKYRIRSSI